MDLANINIYVVGILVGLFTWGLTALGASIVLLFNNFNQKLMDSMLGFAAGVMIAASFFSLLIPALDYGELIYTESSSLFALTIVLLGFMSGGLFLFVLDKIIPHTHPMTKNTEGRKSSMQRSIMLVSAITLHNIPEGLAIGVALGAYNVTGNPEVLVAALTLAIGIGIQNFPEGAAVSLPLYREGFSKKKSFFFGQLSGIVEPFALVVGIFLVSMIKPLLPFALAFAAGAMIFVVVEELIPESQANKNTDLVTMFTLFGLVVMMFLDVSLG